MTASATPAPARRRTGSPSRAVTIPIGNTVPGMMTLLATEADDSSSAPNTAEAGSRCRWSSPTSMRAMWGATRPTKPIVPTKATAAPVSSDTTTKQRSRSASTRTPSARARSSPSRSAVSRHASDQHDRHGDRQHQRHDPDLGHGRALQAAEQPEHDLLQRFRRREELQQRQQRLEQEQAGDARQHQQLGRRTAQPADARPRRRRRGRQRRTRPAGSPRLAAPASAAPARIASAAPKPAAAEMPSV